MKGEKMIQLSFVSRLTKFEFVISVTDASFAAKVFMETRRTAMSMTAKDVRAR